MDSTVVKVPFRDEYNFPDVCPVTGHPADTIISLKASPSGILGVPKYFLGLTPRIRMRISSRAGNRLAWSPMGRHIFNTVFITTCVLAGILLGFGKYGTILMGLGLWTPCLLWQVRHPLPIEVQKNGDEMKFEFRDRSYALQFMELNGGAMEEDAEPPSAGDAATRAAPEK